MRFHGNIMYLYDDLYSDALLDIYGNSICVWCSVVQ